MEQKLYGIRELANWVLDFAKLRNIGLSNMSLNKLVFFAYEHALIRHQRKLTNAKIEAWEHGPVFREIYRSFNDFGSKTITSRAKKYNAVTDDLETVVPHLMKPDEDIIREAIEPLVGLSASVLRELSHASDGPWAATWYHEDPANPGMQISDEVILESRPRNQTQ